MEKPKVELKDVGTMQYDKALEMQKKYFAQYTETQTKQTGTLILLEHPHVYTLGKSGVAENLLIDSGMLEKIGAQYHQSDRGGDITYHGPGQLVGYPILDLNRVGVGLREYIWRLEEAIICTVREFGVEGHRVQGATGVWILGGDSGDKKIAAIGVKASRGVTMHGFALNVTTDLNYFNHINPCGFINKGVTSLEREKNSGVEMKQVKETFAQAFEKQFLVQLITEKK